MMDCNANLRYAVNITSASGAHEHAAEDARQALEAGADPNMIVDETLGYTALAASIVSCDFQLAKVLLEYGADPNIPSKYYGTPLTQHVTQFFHPVDEDIVKTLLEYGARSDLVNKDGETARSGAERIGNQTVIDLCDAFSKEENGKKNKQKKLAQKSALRRYVRHMR